MRAKTELESNLTLKPARAAQKLFDLIYQGAKKKDKADIELALAHCSINVESGLLGTPAHQLAFEGTAKANEALEFLLQTNPEARFALLQQMACGYAQGGRVSESNHAVSDEGMLAYRLKLIKQMVVSYALKGNTFEVNRMLSLAQNEDERFQILVELVSGYPLGKHIPELNAAVNLALNTEERLKLVKQIARDINEVHFCTTDSALLMLAAFSPCYQEELAKELQVNQSESHVDLLALVPKAQRLHAQLTRPTPLSYPLNFQYRLGVNWTHTQEFLLLSGLDLVKKRKLNNNLLLYIASFLGPISS